MKSTTNLVFLTPGFAADERDTASIPSLQLYFLHLKRQHPELNLQILSFQYPFREGEYEWNGIPVYSAGGGNRKINRLQTWRRILARLNRLRRNRQLDLVHSFWLNEATLAGLFFRMVTGTPMVATAMGQDVRRKNRYLPLLRLFSLDVILISVYQTRFLMKTGRMKIRKIIPFGPEPGFYEDQRENRETDILGVGSLNTIKNFPEFIRIAGMLVPKFPSLRCRIIGEGAERVTLERLILENRLEANITLTGRKDYRDVQKEMGSARILLHTAEFEGQGLVITEALAAGMYVVCFPVGIAAGPLSEKVRTGETAGELAVHISDLLSMKETDFSPDYPLRMKDTADGYLDIYRTFV